MTSLVSFPSAGDGRYTDSHEGGQFVMLVVPYREGDIDRGDNCCVDVNITLSMPDVCHTPNDLWHRPLDEHLESFRLSGDLYRYLTDRSTEATGVSRDGDAEADLPQRFPRGFDLQAAAGWVLRAIDPADLSLGVRAAVHLGSSSQSLWDEGAERYWTAARDDLTTEGQQLYDALKLLGGDVEPLILTFLDT